MPKSFTILMDDDLYWSSDSYNDQVYEVIEER